MKKGTFYGVGVGPGDPELLTVFDAVALHTESYLAACELAAFLSANTHPMLEALQSYRAFRELLSRAAESGNGTEESQP